MSVAEKVKQEIIQPKKNNNGLLVGNPVYKPFRYPWCYDAWLTQQRIHWLPEEVTYPLFIAITALSRLIILQGKDSNPELLLYEAGAIVLVAIAVIILRLRYVPILRPIDGIDELPTQKSSKKK